MKKTVIEFMLIGVLGLAAGFGVNAVRAKGSIKPTKNYFDTGPSARIAAVAPSETKPDVSTASETDRVALPDAQSREADPGPMETVALPRDQQPTAPPVAKAPDRRKAAKRHDYQEISFAEVVAIFEDPKTQSGLNVFIDARNDDLFGQGHIPDAVQCDPYQVDQYLDEVVNRTNGVEKVIVYCGGGECEDSIFMCRELVAADVPFDAIYLFAGGWEEWTANDMPVAYGNR